MCIGKNMGRIRGYCPYRMSNLVSIDRNCNTVLHWSHIIGSNTLLTTCSFLRCASQSSCNEGWNFEGDLEASRVRSTRELLWRFSSNEVSDGKEVL